MKAVKGFLKLVFPIAFLKRVFLVVNKVKIATFDRLLFTTSTSNEKRFVVRSTHQPFSASIFDFPNLEGRPEHDYLARWRTWSEDFHIVKFDRKCVIEPAHGWAIVKRRELVYESLAYSRTAHQKKPSLLAFWLRRKKIELDSAISLRDTGEENYFHFYNDILTKIPFLQKNGLLSSDARVIISHKLWDKGYFQEYLRLNPFYAQLRWIVQRDEYIECRNVVFCKTPTHDRSLLNAILSPLRIETQGCRRIFVTRKRERLRFIENIDEIERICVELGIEVVDAADYSLGQQIQLFAESQFIAGIHGAGLTNIMFRSGNCKVYEIFPPPERGYLPFHYAMLSRICGFEYRATIGDASPRMFSGGFIVDPVKFHDDVLDFLGR